MKIIIGLTIISNILAILVTAFGLFHKFENPKTKAVYGYTMAGAIIPYMFMLSTFIGLELVYKHNINYTWLLLCIISPFIIGKLVKFETLKKYTVIQILCFCASLAALLTAF